MSYLHHYVTNQKLGQREGERAPLELADPLSAWRYLLTAGFSIEDDESILTINKGLKGLPPLPARVQRYFPPLARLRAPRVGCSKLRVCAPLGSVPVQASRRP